MTRRSKQNIKSIGIGTILFIILSAFPVIAHKAPSGWEYDINCCNGKDCGQVPMSSVTVTSHGYHLQLQPGEHHMVTKETGPMSFTIPMGSSAIKYSQDSNYHACIIPLHPDISSEQYVVNCFYIPPNFSWNIDETLFTM